MISVVLPIYNESKNIAILIPQLERVMEDWEHEIIAVNDGSRDNSLEELRRFASRNERVKVISFSRNFGQTAAISAGILNSKGEIVVLIDSDLENNPKDIPRLLDKLNDGYDVVSGWRRERWQGQFLTRRLPSVTANKVISKLTGLNLHDYGCTLKAYRKKIIEDVRLYGQMHRFIPVYSFWQGARVTEVPVSFQPRIHGRSNYGMGRIFRVLLDLFLIRFLERFMNRPIHFFGGAGFWFFGAAIVSFIAALLSAWSFGQVWLILGVIFSVAGIQSVLIGVMSEVLMRTYYEGQGRDPFIVEESINFERSLKTHVVRQ